MKAWVKFDAWVNRGPFNGRDLGIYRIVYAVGTLCVVPDIQWLSQYPDSLYAAPAGPFALFAGYPPNSVLGALELLRTGALVLLGLGLWTRLSSILTAIMLVITFGLTYTLGKIDHTILLVITPLILAFANWGDRVSLDSLRRSDRPTSTPQWPMRYLALAIGLAFFVAAAMKLGTGWLSPSSQAARGYFFEYYLRHDRTSWMAEWAAVMQNRPLWEFLDWSTVLLEFAVLAAVPWWRAFRLSLALITFFHLSVFVLMNIPFSQNLIPYAAFISWSVVCRFRQSVHWKSASIGHLIGRAEGKSKLTSAASMAVAVLLTALAWLVVGGSHASQIAYGANTFTVFAGACIGLFYIVYVGVDIFRRGVGRSRQPAHGPGMRSDDK